MAKIDEQIAELKSEMKKFEKSTTALIDDKYSNFDDRLGKLESNFIKINKRFDDNQIHLEQQIEKLSKSINANTEAIRNKKFSIFGQK